MQVLIFGGSGFVGQHLARRLHEAGYEVLVPSRSSRPLEYGQVFPYETDQVGKLFATLKDRYAIINLAGESINSGRWTKKRKESILQSRINLTRALSQSIASIDRKPSVFINASAIGYYGYSQDRVFTETDESGDGFLAEVTRQWEKAASQASPYTRVVTARLGVVLGRNGGALPRMVLPYYFFIGGRVGDGRQWLSWVHIDDVTGILEHCLRDENVNGPVNVTASHPVTMDQFGRTVALVLHRPHWLPVPSAALQLMLGEMSEIVLQGQHVLPQVMTSHGYRFTYSSVEAALRQLLEGKPTRH